RRRARRRAGRAARRRHDPDDDPAMTDFTPATRPIDGGQEPLLDSFLREALPEIKLALGDLIDRDNSRAIPDRYVKMLPVTTLVVTLRPDAAQAVAAIAAQLEEELTDSVMRHGSLYDRDYRVRLSEAGARNVPLFRVGVQQAGQPEPAAITPAPPPPPEERTMHAPPPAPREEPTMASPPPSPPRFEPPPPVFVDPDATRVEGIAPPPQPAAGWQPGRFELVMESEGGEELAVHEIPGPSATVGRVTDRDDLRSDIQLEGSPNVSRRQLALVWAQREGKAGFDVYNLGLNAIHVGEREVPGANAGKGALDFGALDESRVWVGPGEAVRIGGHGPIVRIRDCAPTGADLAGDASADDADREPAPEVEEDPDRTQFG
ncbi:MAG TPA: hypothetical protein VFQ45_13695, partial [Longimicrobium sp.]|nr:hypothetical protein [Longimicrobium sp.]